MKKVLLMWIGLLLTLPASAADLREKLLEWERQQPYHFTVRLELPLPEGHEVTVNITDVTEKWQISEKRRACRYYNQLDWDLMEKLLQRWSETPSELKRLKKESPAELYWRNAFDQELTEHEFDMDGELHEIEPERIYAGAVKWFAQENKEYLDLSNTPKYIRYKFFEDNDKLILMIYGRSAMDEELAVANQGCSR